MSAAPRLTVSLAIGDYDHTRDLVAGVVRAEGVELIASVLPVEEVFYRTTHFQEWDVSEMSFGKYIAQRSRGDESLTAIPVFPSRAFRISSIYVRADSDLTDPRQLAGRRVGLPEWAQTASIYSRGYLQHEAGVPLTEVNWVQAGVRQAGRVEKVDVDLPAGVRLTRIADRSLSELLEAGEIDAVLSARDPAVGGKPQAFRRLVSDFVAAETAYYSRTGVFPIMHVVVIRTDLYQAQRWLARNLMSAFEQARDRSLERLSDITCSHVPLAWVPHHLDQMRALMGEQLWPYGVEPNRRTLDAFVRFAHEQGVASRVIAPEALFAPETLSAHRV